MEEISSSTYIAAYACYFVYWRTIERCILTSPEPSQYYHYLYHQHGIVCHLKEEKLCLPLLLLAWSTFQWAVSPWLFLYSLHGYIEHVDMWCPWRELPLSVVEGSLCSWKKLYSFLTRPTITDIHITPMHSYISQDIWSKDICLFQYYYYYK